MYNLHILIPCSRISILLTVGDEVVEQLRKFKYFRIDRTITEHNIKNVESYNRNLQPFLNFQSLQVRFFFTNSDHFLLGRSLTLLVSIPLSSTTFATHLGVYINAIAFTISVLVFFIIIAY